jgi:carboxypeptidase family protein/PDZ domain-containing protein
VSSPPAPPSRRNFPEPPGGPRSARGRHPSAPEGALGGRPADGGGEPASRRLGGPPSADGLGGSFGPSSAGDTGRHVVSRPDAPLPPSGRAFVIDEPTPLSRRPLSEQQVPRTSRPSLLSLRGPDAPPPAPPPKPKVRPTAWVVAAMLAVPLALVVAVLAWLPTWLPREASAPASSALPAAQAAPVPRLRGRVVDEEGDGVDGARVVLVPDGPAYAVLYETSSDVLGSFALPSVPGKALRLVAEQGDKLVVSAPLTAPPSGEVEGVVLTLARGRLLRGRVVDEEGAPVVGATLTVEALPWPGRASTSGAEGAFEMARVPSDAPAVVVSAHGFMTARAALGPAGAEGPEALDVTLRRAPELKGSVLDPEGKPLEGALVLACEGKDGGRATSDQAGGFRLPASAEGCQVVAQHDEFAASEPVTALAGQALTLRLGAGGSIAGFVVDEGGAPVANFSVGVESFTPATGEHAFSIRSGPSRPFQDPGGAFSIDRLAPGSYVLTATTEGKPIARSQSLEVGPGRVNSGVRIVMAAGGTVDGRVYDEGKNAPVVGARVAFDALTSTQPDASPGVFTDGEGNFRLENAPAGPFTLRVEHEGYRTRLVSGLRVASRQSLRQEISLAPTEAPGLAFGGIGATLQQTREGLVFTDAFANDPAYRAGVRSGDRLRRINGDSVEGLSLADAIQRLRGPGGTVLLVTVEREGVPWPLDFIVSRAEIVR